jgi:AAA+ ATPase superfamily predicted ATPase
MDHTDVKNASQMSAEWLLQPNPFTNQLRISVNLFSQNQIHITIKNTLGNDVFKLSQNIYQGQHVIVVNQLDILPAGIYFVQLQCGNHTEQKRIIKY